MSFIKKKVFGQLKDALNEFLYDFDEEKLDLAWWSGKIVLKNLIIKPDKVNKIFKKGDAPISLKAGLIS